MYSFKNPLFFKKTLLYLRELAILNPYIRKYYQQIEGITMKKIKFIKEPGYTYDLFFIFYLYFNKEHCTSSTINFNRNNKLEQDIAFYNRVLENFAPIPEELLPFFRIIDDERCFMTRKFFDPFRDEFMSSFELPRVQEALTDLKQVVANVVNYYFPDEECKAEDLPSLNTLNGWLKKSSFTAESKSSLYSFFIDPAPVVQKLSYELIAKEFQLSKWREGEYPRLMELQENFDLEMLIQKISTLPTQRWDMDKYDEFYVTFCLINKNCIKAEFYGDKAVLFLGSNYEEILDQLWKQTPQLDTFGNALAEKNRVDILELILQEGEITIKDIEQRLGFTGTNAYYHLSLMIKANLLCTRTRGRTVLYSLNRRYFDAVMENMQKYGSGGKKK